MPDLDERLSRRFVATAREADENGVVRELERRVGSLRRRRRASIAAVVVLALGLSSIAGYELVRAFRDVRKPTVVPLDRYPTPVSSRSNGRIAYVDSEGGDDDIFTVEPDSSDVRQLTAWEGSDADPAWSPDGTKIAYVRHELPSSSQGNVWVMDADGSNPHRVAQANDKPRPVWSPDGKWIAFNRGQGRLYRVAATGGTPELLIDGGVGQHAWSPDGRSIAAVGRGAIAVLDLETRRIHGVVAGDVLEPAWSPDGRWIAFRAQICRACSYDVFTVRADGTDLVRYTQDETFDQDVSWSPDGRFLMVERVSIFEEIPGSGGPGTSGVYAIAVDGSGLTLLRPGGGGRQPAWQPIPRSSEASAPPAISPPGICRHSSAQGDLDGDGALDRIEILYDGAASCWLGGGEHTLQVRLASGATETLPCPNCVVLTSLDVNEDGRDEALVQVEARGATSAVALFVVDGGSVRRVQVAAGAEGYPAGPAAFDLHHGPPERPDYAWHLRGLKCRPGSSGPELVAVAVDSDNIREFWPEPRDDIFDVTLTFFRLEGTTLTPLETTRQANLSRNEGFSAYTQTASAFAICQEEE